MAFIIHNSYFEIQKFSDYEFSKLINYLIQNQLVDKQIIVVPTRKIVRQLKKHIIKEYACVHKKPISQLYIYNLEDFFKEIYNILKIKPNAVEISEGIQLMLIEQAIENSNLQYYRFQDNFLKLDIIHKFARVINGLRLDGVPTNSLLNEYLIIDKRKSDDIDQIHLNYRQLLGDNLVDIPRIFEEISIALENNSTKQNLSNYFIENLKIQNIFLIGFSNFRNLELSILSKFVQIKIPFALVLEYSEIAGPLFGNYQKIIQFFLNNTFSLYNNEKYLLFSNDLELTEKLSFHLFDETKTDKIKSLSEEITIIECANQLDEVNYITKLVKYLNQVENIKLSEIAIVTRNLNDYAPMFFNAFKSNHIPINITHRKNIKQSVIVRNLLTIYKMIKSDFSYDQLKLLFESRFISLGNINKSNFLETIKILKLKQNYLKFNDDFVVNRANSFLNYLQSVSRSNLNDKHLLKSNELLINKIDKFLEDYKILSELFDQFEKEIEITELVLYNERIISKFNVIPTFLEYTEKTVKSKDKYDSLEYNDLLEAIEAEANALDKFNKLIRNLQQTLPYLDHNTISLEELIDRLEIATSNEKYQIREKDNFGVTLTSLDQIRMIPLKVKILCGAIDGSLPLTYNTDKFLGKELIDSKYEHYRSEKILFYQFLNDQSWTKFHSKKFITFPKITNNQINTLSPLVDSLIRKSDIIEKNKYILSQNLDSALPVSRVMINENEVFQFINDYNLSNTAQLTINLDQLFNIYITKINEKLNSMPIKLNYQTSKELNNKFYTINDFELYAACPYKFYLSKILKVDFEEEKDVKIDPREIGSIYHRILYEFFVYLQKTFENPIGSFQPVVLSFNKIEFYRNLLLKIAKNELDNPLYDHPLVKIQTNKLTKNNAAINPLLNWLNNELSHQSKNKIYPTLFEYPIKTTILIDSDNFITYDIKIDRVDIRFEYQSIGSYDFTVVDYKTKMPDIKDENIYKFESFQMPIYMISLINEFKSKGIDFIPHFGTYVSIQDFKNEYKYILDRQKPTALSIDQMLEEVAKKTIEIKNSMIAGNFPLTSDTNKNCKNCPYYPICRVKSQN